MEEFLKIARELVEEFDPYEKNDGSYGDFETYCMFCGNHAMIKHSKDCLYRRAEIAVEAYDRETIAHSLT